MHPNDGRVVSNFIVQALRNNPVTIYGDGSQTRSFCYIDDLIEAFILIMQTNDDFIGPINIGNPYEVKISELADIVIKLTGSSSKIIRKKLPEDDPIQRKPDISLANKTISWDPQVPLLEGLKRTIDYFETKLSKE